MTTSEVESSDNNDKVKAKIRLLNSCQQMSRLSNRTTTMQILVKTLTGKTIALGIESSNTIKPKFKARKESPQINSASVWPENNLKMVVLSLGLQHPKESTRHLVLHLRLCQDPPARCSLWGLSCQTPSTT